MATLVLTQWNHHRLDYLRPTGLFCLVSKVSAFLRTFFKNRNIYLHPDTSEYRNTCFDTVEPSSARLPPAHRIILPCVETHCYPPHIVDHRNTHFLPETVAYRKTCFDTVEPSSARLPPAHRIILPCVKTVLSSTHF